MAPDRKPPLPMQSRIAKSIRFMPSEWEGVEVAARGRGLEPAVFVRMLTLYALSIVESPRFGEAAFGVPSQMLPGARRTRRF